MKLIYVANINLGPVIGSQVLELLNHYQKSGKFEKIVLLAGIKYNKPEYRSITAKLHNGIEVRFFKSYPVYPLFDYLTIHSLRKSIRSIEHLEQFVFHVRGVFTSYVVSKALGSIGIKTNKIIPDIRGVIYEETLEYSRKNPIAKKLKLSFIRRIFDQLPGFSNISAVSNSLREHIIQKTGCSKTKIFINHCLAIDTFHYNPEHRKAKRKELGLKDEEVLMLLSSGGNAKWQNTENAINRLCDGFKILNLSKSVIEHPNVINRFVKYEDVPENLCAADVAIIWREESITNKVASPVKFSEFMCCGLPVITNNSIDLIADYITNTGFGAVLKNMDEINTNIINDLSKLDRNTISAKGKRLFSVKAIAERYIKLYRQLIENNG